jgi:4-hydroxyacetophenone monooxygenase
MDVRGRRGQSLEALWRKDGARAYIGTMLPGFPNFFMVYGPNITPFFSGLGMIEMEELATRFAMQCIEALILDEHRTIDVKPEAYDAFNAELDRRERTKAYLDPRVDNAFKNAFGRSAINCPFDVRLMWQWWRDPTGANGAADKSDPLIRPYLGEDLLVE